MARFAFLLAMLGAGGAPASAQAETASATIAVSLTVEPSCGVSATPMAFSGRAGETMDASSRIAVVCNDDTAVSVRLDGGLNPQGSTRRLAGEGGHVEYAVYFDPARSLAWEAGEPLAGTAGATPLSLAAYGRIDPAATASALGSYRDTITVTVDF